METRSGGAWARPIGEEGGAVAGALARAVVRRFDAELSSAVRRRPTQEATLAGGLRALLPMFPELTRSATVAFETLARRRSFERPLYGALARGLVSAQVPGSTPVLESVLSADGAGGLSSVSAATLSRDPALASGLVRAAMNRQPHLIFAAEVARVVRGESSGEHLIGLAPKIKETHRISLCEQLLVPLFWLGGVPDALIPALEVIRGSERHLGRWLLLAELSQRAGDPRPRGEAERNSRSGPASSRAAWELVHWALAPEMEASVRPTVELVSRLSDRPSAERDTAFLFRMADAGAKVAEAMLESLCRGRSVDSEAGVRALASLVLRYGRTESLAPLERVARSSKKEGIRGLAVAALFDARQRELARRLAEDLSQSKKLSTLAWCALVNLAGDREGTNAPAESAARPTALASAENHAESMPSSTNRRSEASSSAAKGSSPTLDERAVDRTGTEPAGVLIEEATFRRIQRGWVE